MRKDVIEETLKAPVAGGLFYCIWITRISGIKKPPEGGYNDITTLLLLIIQLIFPWYPGRDLNSYSHKPRDFKSLVSTDSTTRAPGKLEARSGVEPD